MLESCVASPYVPNCHIRESWRQPLGQVAVTAAEAVALLGLLNQEVSGDR